MFDTDGIFPIIEATASLTKVPYAKNPVPYRVIADHARALSFMIADGILPGNEGRGYVERRLLRRAARFGRELGLEKPFLHEVAQTVVDLMSHQYPELAERRVQIERVIHTEEERFGGTLARGMDLLDDVLGKLDPGATVPGDDLFRLHDTYGFPLDLAKDIAEDRGYVIDRKGFDAAMARQREQARSAWAGSGEEALSPVYRNVREAAGDTEFVGYQRLSCDASILAVIRDGGQVDALEVGQTGEIVLDRTPFYAESGGQVGDTGTLEASEGSAHVSGAKAPVGKMTLHTVRVTLGTLRKGDTVTAQVDTEAREATQGHHTATHLLQAALQDIVGDHVHQAGSHVGPDRLRFDFTHFEGIPADRLADVERQVNRYVRSDTPVDTQLMPLDKAREAGAMALFGEKYDDVVRVVRTGDISMELCGGTHVDRTGKIGYFKILSESSVAAGVRRIEAVCGEASVDTLLTRDEQLTSTAQMLNAGLEDLRDRVASLLDENKRLSREVTKWKQAAATGASVDYMSQVKEVEGVKLLACEVEGQDPAGLRMLMDNLRDKLKSGVVALGSASEGKVSLCVSVSKDLTDRLKAGDIVKRLAAIVGGGGGGRPDMAQAGGKLPEKLPEAIGSAAETIRASWDPTDEYGLGPNDGPRRGRRADRRRRERPLGHHGPTCVRDSMHIARRGRRGRPQDGRGTRGDQSGCRVAAQPTWGSGSPSREDPGVCRCLDASPRRGDRDAGRAVHDLPSPTLPDRHGRQAKGPKKGGRPGGGPLHPPGLSRPGKEPTGSRHAVSGDTKEATRRSKRSITQSVLSALIYLIVFVLIAATGAAVAAYLIYDHVTQPGTPGDLVRVTVPEGATGHDIGELLASKGLVESPWFFRLAIKLDERREIIKHGYYDLPKGLSPMEVLHVLYDGPNVLPDPAELPPGHRLTIPEGLTIEQMAGMFADPAAFQAAATDKALLTELAVDTETLEGFLMPNTYFFDAPPSPHEAIQRMLAQFKEDYRQLLADHPEASARDTLEVVTVASLVEREARVEEERGLIAAVVYNRLKRGMPLQLDATLQYALGKYGERMLDVDKLVDSPYNTYKHRGLPPGPIANPGVASLRAALVPAEADYLYFVSNADGKTHTFSRTSAEHQRAVRQYRREIAVQRRKLREQESITSNAP